MFSEGELILPEQDFLVGVSHIKLLLNDATLNGVRIYSPCLTYPHEEGKQRHVTVILDCLDKLFCGKETTTQ